MKNNINKKFDYLGFPAFAILFIDAIYDFSLGVNGWRIWLRLIICFLGMVVDAYLIFLHKEQN